MNFWKMNGNGNDFLVFDARVDLGFPWSLKAPLLCDRRKGLGADGLLVMEQSTQAAFRMRLFNADGSEGEMCGNGARCIARFAYMMGVAPSSMVFETQAGLVGARVADRFVELEMKGFVLPEEWQERTLRLCGETWRATFINTGVPHLVLLTSELPDADFCRQVGKTAREDRSLFPQGTNVTFMAPVGRGELEAVTYERGVEDLTLSCGTGCVAAALAAQRLLNMGQVIEVHNPGGTNRVTLKSPDEALLGGYTVLVAQGSLSDEMLSIN